MSKAVAAAVFTGGHGDGGGGDGGGGEVAVVVVVDVEVVGAKANGGDYGGWR